MTGPFETTVFLLIWILGFAFWGGVGYGFYLWIRKLRRDLDEGALEGSLQDRLLDELQELRIEMGIVADRLGRIESGLEGSRELPDRAASPGALSADPLRKDASLPPASERRGEDPVPPPPGDARS